MGKLLARSILCALAIWVRSLRQTSVACQPLRRRLRGGNLHVRHNPVPLVRWQGRRGRERRQKRLAGEPCRLDLYGSYLSQRLNSDGFGVHVGHERPFSSQDGAAAMGGKGDLPWNTRQRQRRAENGRSLNIPAWLKTDPKAAVRRPPCASTLLDRKPAPA